MLFLALLGVFLLPTNPDIGPYLHIWLLTCLLVLGFISFKPLRGRKIRGYEDARYGYNDEIVVGKKGRGPGTLLGFSVGVLAIAEFGLIQTTFSVKYDFPLAQSAVYLMIALVVVSVVTALGPRRVQSVERFFFQRRGGLFVYLVCFMGLFLGAYFLAKQIPKYIASGPPASWPKLLTFARDQANRIDQEAVLESVSADPPYDALRPYSPQNTTLEVDFVFRRPSGPSIRIIALDVNPPRLVKVQNPWDSMGRGPGKERLRPLEERLQNIKLAPRKVWRLTEEEGQAYARVKASTVTPRLSMYLDHNWQERFGVPGGWNMEYSVDKTGDASSLNLRVDGATGKVVARELWPDIFEMKPTPGPTPGSTIVP